MRRAKSAPETAPKTPAARKAASEAPTYRSVLGSEYCLPLPREKELAKALADTRKQLEGQRGRTTPSALRRTK